MDDTSAPNSDSTVSIATAQEAGQTVLRLSGDLDFATAPAVADALSNTVAERLVVDCSEISFMDSSGLNVLVKAWNDTNTGDSSRFAIVNPSRQVQRVIEICGVDGIVGDR